MTTVKIQLTEAAKDCLHTVYPLEFKDKKQIKIEVIKNSFVSIHQVEANKTTIIPSFYIILIQKWRE